MNHAAPKPAYQICEKAKRCPSGGTSLDGLLRVPATRAVRTLLSEKEQLHYVTLYLCWPMHQRPTSNPVASRSTQFQTERRDLPVPTVRRGEQPRGSGAALGKNVDIIMIFMDCTGIGQGEVLRRIG
jgi:hypothetical protein